jgi:hypothetical protein
MSAPGERLRALASRICGPSTMTYLIDPIVADLQAEYAASTHASAWRRARVLALGYAGFWKAVILQAALSAVAPSRGDGSAMRRIVSFSGVGFVLFTCLLLAPPLLRDVPGSWSRTERAILALILIPQAVPLSFPAAVCVGVLCAMRARRITARHLSIVLIVGAMASACAWIMLEWGTPRANQQFRELVIARVTDGRTVHIEPGLNEMGLSRLGQRTDGEAIRHYHLLWALCFATIPLGVFALGMAGTIRRLAPAVLLAFAAPLGYIMAMMAFDNLSHGTLLQVIAAVWAPNALFLCAGLIALVSRRTQPA